MAAPVWSDDTIADLLTRQRLCSYLDAMNSELSAALGLYDWNTDAAGAALSLIAMTEVVARNAMDEALCRWSLRRHGTENWFDTVQLDTRGNADLVAARARAAVRQPAEIHGKVVAELTFGFWRYLTASRYLTLLWTPALHTAFPHGHVDVATRRGCVEQRMQRLLFVRNRAAHHEPLHQRNLLGLVSDAIDLAGWISPDAAAWMRARERMTVVYGCKPGAVASGPRSDRLSGA
ncbi:hypothetical protein [Nocardia sp. NPDC058497]|uniref:hypothetical protein n=1 Tax=Nocardia sp. NPDC058497 TaxID=3346529 RepID=UPI003647DF0A